MEFTQLFRFLYRHRLVFWRYPTFNEEKCHKSSLDVPCMAETALVLILSSCAYAEGSLRILLPPWKEAREAVVKINERTDFHNFCALSSDNSNEKVRI